MTTIIIKNSSTSSAVPGSGDLTKGELAVNVTDKKLYTKDNGGSVVKLVGGLGNQEANAVAVTGGSIDGTPIGGTTASTASFTTLSASGNVTLSGGTANGVLYLNGSKVATSGSALTFDGSGKLALGNVAHTSFIPTTSLTLGNSAANAEIRIGQQDASALITKWVYNATVGNAYAAIETYGQANYIQFGASDFRWQVASSEAMRLTSTGLGIGASSPAYKLHVAGAPAATSGALIYVRDSAAAAGTASLGGIAFFSSPGSDFYIGKKNNTAGTGWLSFGNADNGTEYMALDASGNLGLGVTPSAWGSAYKSLEVNGAVIQASSSNKSQAGFGNNYYHNGTNYIYSTSNYATSYFQNSGAHTWYTAASGTAGNAISFTQAMTLDASGNLGVGLTNPSAYLGKIAVTGNFAITTGGKEYLWDSTNSSGNYIQNAGSSGNSALTFGKYASGGDIEQMRIDSSGNLLVGTTSASFGYKMYLAPSGTYNNGIYYKSDANNTNAMDFRNTSDTQVGSIYVSSTATVYAVSSDYRLKNTIAPMTGALAKVAQLKPVTYKWNADGSDGEGFIAHELAEVCPQAVTGEKDAVDAEGNPQYQGIDTSFLVATLTAAIQELKAEFDAYKASHP